LKPTISQGLKIWSLYVPRNQWPRRLR